MNCPYSVEPASLLKFFKKLNCYKDLSFQITYNFQLTTFSNLKKTYKKKKFLQGNTIHTTATDVIIRFISDFPPFLSRDALQCFSTGYVGWVKRSEPIISVFPFLLGALRFTKPTPFCGFVTRTPALFFNIQSQIF